MSLAGGVGPPPIPPTYPPRRVVGHRSRKPCRVADGNHATRYALVVWALEMKVRWTIVVSGRNLGEMSYKAQLAFNEFFGDRRYKDSLIPEPIFLDVEPDDDMIEDGVILGYKAWASRNFETAE